MSSVDAAQQPVQVPLGRTDVQISPVGVGAMVWGDAWGGYYGRGYSANDSAAAFRVCLDNGVTLFDTAEVYSFGRSERVLGRYAQASSGPVRPVVATKFAPLPWRWRPSALPRALRTSLRRLGLERVDLYQMHWHGGPVSIERWMDVLADAVDARVVRAVGVSNYDAAQMRRAHTALARRGIPLASNQIQYSLLHREPERDGVLDACRELGVTPIAYMPLHMGVLTGKYTAQRRPGGLARRFLPDMSSGRLARAAPLLTSLRDIGAAHGAKTPGQVALNWLIARGAVPIAGVRNERQARELVGVLGWGLAPGEVAALDTASDSAR